MDIILDHVIIEDMNFRLERTRLPPKRPFRHGGHHLKTSKDARLKSVSQLQEAMPILRSFKVTSARSYLIENDRPFLQWCSSLQRDMCIRE